MKKITFYIVLLVVVAVAVTGFWIYQRYVKSNTLPPLTFTVARGDVTEIVRARGEVVSQKDFEMEFPFGGTVSQVLVNEGDLVARGEVLATLDTSDLAIELGRLEAVRAANEAALEKLIAGETPEDIRVSEAEVASAETTLENTKKGFVDALNDAYTKADDAIRTRVDQLLLNPRTNPQLSFITPTESQAGIDLVSLRVSMETKFTAWQASLTSLSVSSDLETYTMQAEENLSLARSVLDKATLVLSSLAATEDLSQTTIDGWRATVSTGRTGVSTAIANLSTARETYRAAQSSLDYERQALALKKAGTREETIDEARATVTQAERQIDAVKDKMYKATLRSPVAARVMKIYIERREVFTAGSSAISLAITDQKIQADISELDIGKIDENDGDEVDIVFDAYPGVSYGGQVVSVEPQAVVKDGDKYFRINVLFTRVTSTEAAEEEPRIRTGMSTDLIIKTSHKQGILTIPELAVYKRSGDKNAKYVKMVENGAEKEVDIRTGISDGENVEVVEGLTEGQMVVVSGE